MFETLAKYTKAFNLLPLGWLKGAAVEGTPQAKTVMQEKIKYVLSSQGSHIRFLPYADRYTEETDAIRKAYPVMLRDPYIKQALYTKVFGVASLDLQVHAASKSPRDKEIADFVKHCLKKCKGGSRRAIMNVAVPGAIFGYSVTEKVMLPPTGKGQFGKKITLAALKSKDVNKIQLEGDEFGNITGLRDRPTNQFYHASNFLIYTHMPLFENPTGTSDFRAAYRAYWLADTAWQLRAIGLERYGLPFMRGYYTDNTQQTALEEQLPNIRGQGWMTIPEGARVEALDLAGRGTADFESAIRDLREEMVLAIAGAILQMLTITGTAEMRGSADVQKGTFELLQWYLAQEAADIFNDQLFPDLVDLNYRAADYPTCTFGGVNDGAMKDSIAVDQFFLSNNLPLSKEETYEKYGRQQPLSDADKVMAPQQQPQQSPFGGGGGFGGGRFAEGDEQGVQPDAAKYILGVQQSYAAGKIPRAAAIANAQMVKPDLTPDAAQALFPIRTAQLDGSAKFDESFVDKFCQEGKNKGKPGPCPDETKAKARAAKPPVAKPAAQPKPSINADHVHGEYEKLRQSSLDTNGHSYEQLDKHAHDLLSKLPMAELKKVAEKANLAVEKPTKGWIVGALKDRLKQNRATMERVSFRPLGNVEAPVTRKTQMAEKFDDELSAHQAARSAPIYWPDVRQTNSWTCGPAEVVAAGRFSGIAIPPVDYVAKEAGSDQANGTPPGRLIRTLAAYGIDHQAKARMTLEDLRAELQQGHPVIVHISDSGGHYVAVIGSSDGMLEIHDPANGYRDVPQDEFLAKWDGKDRFGVRYFRWGVAIKGRRGDGPSDLDRFGDEGQNDAIVADAPHQDTDNAIRLAQAVQKNGVDVVSRITADALARMSMSKSPLQVASFFTMDERQQLADALASTLATADLLGRSRMHIRAEEVRGRGEAFKFSEPTSFQRFDDDPSPDAARVSALPPSSAVAYFQALVPTVRVPSTFAGQVANQAFTLAGVTETSILQRVKDVITNRLETGRAFRAAPGDIQEVLDEAGISQRNPFRAEQIFRTNMMSAYTSGTINAMRDPDVAELFPVWQYHGIRDGRQRLQHQAHFGRYFDKSVDFETVRDHFYNGEFSGWACRCNPSPVSKFEWQKLQDRGEQVSTLGAYEMPVA